jgi:hypothetical protein
MTKSRIIIGLTMMLSILAITATPAAAAFRGLNGTSGSSQLKAGTVASLQVIPGGAAIVSSKAPDTWRIQDSKSEQNVTKEGGHLDQRINFENPVVEGINVELNNPIEVQYVQTGPTTSDIAISKTVRLTIPLGGGAFCAVALLPSANKQLTKVKDINIESSKALEAVSEITNIVSESAPEAGCKAVGIPPTSTTGILKATSIEHGVIQV